MRSAFFMAMAVFLAAVRLAAEDVNAVVAVVNNDIITTGELNKLVGPTLETIQKKYEGAQLKAVLRREYDTALNRLIDKRLLIQEGKRMLAAEEIEPRLIDQNLDSIIKDLIAQAGSLLQLKKILAKGGETIEEKKERTREEILIQMVIQKHVRSRVSVSPAEVRDYYLKRAGDYTLEKKVKSRHILIPFEGYPTPEKAKEFAESLRQKIVEGADFATLAQQHSKGPHASDGGLWEFMARPAFGGAVDEALFSLNKGEISPVIETKRGYQIVQVVDIQPGGKTPFEDVESQIRQHLQNERLNKRYMEYLAELRRTAYIRIP